MEGKSLFITIIVGIVAIIGLVLGIMMIEKVPQGNVAVMYNTKGVSDKTLSAGWHLVSPLAKTTDYPVRTQTKQYKSINASTSDGKNLRIGVSINYHVDPTKVVGIFNKFGNADIEQLENGYLQTRVQDGLRQSVAKYSVIETFGVKASDIKKDTLETLQKRLGKEGFIVEDIAISAPEADKATQDSINERVKANQELERAKTDKKIAKSNAEKAEIEAKGQAKANEIVNKSLTPELIEKQKIDKWDGKQPLQIGGSGVIVDASGK